LGNIYEGVLMQKKVRYLGIGIISLIIIACLVIFPAAAAISFNVPGSAYMRFNSIQVPGSSYAAGLTSHAVADYYANPARFLVINVSTFSAPASTFNFLDGSSTSSLSSANLFPSSDYSSTNDGWNDLFPTPTPAYNGGCGS
jgi:hypothetical protein